MKYTVEPKDKQYCEVKFHRICKRPDYLVQMGMERQYTLDGEDDSVWYNADTKEFYFGDMWFCDLSEVVNWKPSKAPIVGLTYK